MSAGQIVVAGLAGIVVAAIAALPLSKWMKRREVARASKEFKLQREGLEAKFFEIASCSGKPRGLRWVRCDWQPA